MEVNNQEPKNIHNVIAHEGDGRSGIESMACVGLHNSESTDNWEITNAKTKRKWMEIINCIAKK